MCFGYWACMKIFLNWLPTMYWAGNCWIWSCWPKSKEMASTGSKTDIWVYAHWKSLSVPVCIGVLSAHQAKGHKAFSFEYHPDWLNSKAQRIIDPDIMWFSGPQYPVNKENFGIFLDSMPDRWGRTLLKRKAAHQARMAGLSPPTLYDVDFLLGVFDESRMGALRFKRDPSGPYLDNDSSYTVPPWNSIRNLQYAVDQLESGTDESDTHNWLNVLLAPGSSLGGARPKANILDEDGQPWIAKFPSKQDDLDKGAWEYLVYQLAIRSGVFMSPSKIQKVMGSYHTFFTKRFDRIHGERIHFASAMTMTGNTEEMVRDKTPSYLELAEFIQFSGTNVEKNLKQLWTRIAFNIAVSNTDDHLRNHGFLLSDDGWELSPAFDINPSNDKNGLALNIDLTDNALDFELAKSAGAYFQLSLHQMNEIIEQIRQTVQGWRMLADGIGIPKREQDRMAGAFNSSS